MCARVGGEQPIAQPEINTFACSRCPISDVEKADHNYAPETVPQRPFMPVNATNAKSAPVKVCPVRPPGRKRTDPRLITTGASVAATARPRVLIGRGIQFSKPSIPKDKINPNMSYLGNRPRPRGVVEKCHFCIQRTRAGRYPACLEVCPTGARKFGNILDPNSEVSYILKNKRVFIHKEEVGTLPRFFYYFDV